MWANILVQKKTYHPFVGHADWQISVLQISKMSLSGDRLSNGLQFAFDVQVCDWKVKIKREILWSELISRQFLLYFFSMCFDASRLLRAFAFSASSSSFFYFFMRFALGQEIIITVYVILFMHYSWNPQPFYSKKNIKNEFHDTIYLFKNYFATVFLVFSFQF